MRVGLTYNLRNDALLTHADPPDLYSEFDSPETITQLSDTLTDLGHEVIAIGDAWQLMQFLCAGKRVDMVFNIAEGLGGRAREAQVPCILEVAGIPYTFSDPLSLALALDKGMTKRVWHSAGLATAPFWVVQHLSDLEHLLDNLPVTNHQASDDQAAHLAAFTWPLFAKPLHEGTSKGISDAALCDSPEILLMRVKGLLERYRQAVIIEPYLPGREFTVALLGTGAHARVLGMMEITFNQASPAYGQQEKATYTTSVAYCAVSEHPLAAQLATLALNAYTSLGCRDAGRVDIRLDAQGQPHLLEINPLPGLHPTHSDLSIIARQQHVSYNDVIHCIMASAVSRLELPSDLVTMTPPAVLIPPSPGAVS